MTLQELQALAAQKAQQATQEAQGEPQPERTDKPAKLTADKIERLKSLKNDTLEYCPTLTIKSAGTWLWATGNTRQYKQELINLGWKWAPRKVAWYYCLPELKRKRRPSNLTVEQIEERYQELV